MSFEERKEKAQKDMHDHDRSKKGSVDEHVKPLLKAINDNPDFYSTSSCSGRILLLHEPVSGKKNEFAWPYVTHDLADINPFLDTLKSLDGSEGVVWLRMQTCIVHVACRDLESAKKLLSVFYPHGWKRSGIFSMEKDIMVELLSVEHMDAPVMDSGKLLASEDYISYLVETANNKLKICHEKILSAAQRVESLSQ